MTTPREGLDLGPQQATGLSKWATLSPDGRYRYLLGRQVLLGLHNKTMLFIMLNPSVADAETDDPTIRRCIYFARREACARLEVVNCYALRSTDPKALRSADDPVGPENAKHVRSAVARADVIVYAWGNLGPAHVLDSIHEGIVVPSGKTPMCLGRNKNGQPRHPLYLSRSTYLEPFELRKS